MTKESDYDPDEFVVRDFYSPHQAAETIGISISKLQRWEKFGIVRPCRHKSGNRTFRQYSELDISRATLVHLLMSKCFYSLEDALKKLKELT